MPPTWLVMLLTHRLTSLTLLMNIAAGSCPRDGLLHRLGAGVGFQGGTPTPAISDPPRPQANPPRNPGIGRRERPAGSLNTEVRLNRRERGQQAQPAAETHDALTAARQLMHNPRDSLLSVSRSAARRQPHHANHNPPPWPSGPRPASAGAAADPSGNAPTGAAAPPSHPTIRRRQQKAF